MGMNYDKKLIKKLTRPIHITYISDVYFKNNMDLARKEIQSMIDDGLVVESKYGKDYYVLTAKTDG
jgi:hypothetical protein